MATKYIAVQFFDDDGAPEEGLSPTVTIWDLTTDTKVVEDAAMAEVGDGWYKYLMATYSPGEYAFTCDNGAGKYASGVSQIDTEARVDALLDATLGKWELSVPNDLKLYKADNTTLVAAFKCYTSSGQPTINNIAKVERV